MSTFKIGDKVEIVGPPVSVPGFIPGSVGSVCGLDRHGWPKVDGGGEGLYYHPSNVRLLPGFKVGDRVRRPGKPVAFLGESETTIVAVYRADSWDSGQEPCEVYMLADGDLRTAEQLEPAPEPKREPKAGEVWSGRGSVCIVNSSGQLVSLATGDLIHRDARQVVGYGVFSFAAASAKDAAALGLL